MKYDLIYCSMGNGLTIYNRAVEEHGDYKKIAHIDRDRKVTFYDKKLPTNIKENIITEACTNNTNISATQDQKIFSSPPAKYKKEE